MRKLKLIALIAIMFLCQAGTFTIDPTKNAVWHNERGLFFLGLRYYAAAIKEFQLAITLNPDSEVSSTFYNNLGRSYYEIGDYNSAEIIYKKAIELKPYYLEFRENLIKTYEQKGTLNEIVEFHNNLIIEDPGNLQSYLMLGLIYKKYQNNDYALIYLNKFVQLAPEFGITNQIKQIISDLKEQN